METLINLFSNNLGYIYFSGMFISCIMCIAIAMYDAKVSKSEETDLDDFPGIFAFTGLISWIGVVLLGYNIYKRFLK